MTSAGGIPKTLEEAAKLAKAKIDRESQNTHLTNQFAVLNSRIDALEKERQGLLLKLGEMDQVKEDLTAKMETLWSSVTILQENLDSLMEGIREAVSPRVTVVMTPGQKTGSGDEVKP